MPQYRVYFVDNVGRVSVPPEVINCVDDAEARKKAKQFIDGRDIELWEGARLVELYPRR